MNNSDHDEDGPNFTYDYCMWSEDPDVDRQYKTLYDKLMDIPNFYERVCEEGNIRGDDDCQCLLEAKKVADDDQFCYLGEGSVINCLEDMQKEREFAKELDMLKEYEKCLVDSNYWKNKEGESAPVELEAYQPYTGYCCTGLTLDDVKNANVKKDFESWLFMLGSCVREEELQKRLEDAHANRVNISKGSMKTRIRYIGKKLEHCRKAGIDFESSKQHSIQTLNRVNTTPRRGSVVTAYEETTSLEVVT